MKNKRSLAKLARLFCGSKESFSETEKPPIIDVQLLGAVHNAGSLVCLAEPFGQRLLAISTTLS
ncbi:hypothetical protein AB4544_23895, partial [Vibrio sp. 10N.222.45.F7]|uniref:hypothetical protein n=1 Tax=Vibrio sp. 10N.222.45.F7 TaxID=3229598 RepID=UPI00354FE7C9